MNPYSKMRNHLEVLLHYIHKNWIALDEDEVKQNNAILHAILNLLLMEMKRNDALFCAMFKELFYGGSFYERLKVAHPDEYDIHVTMKLPPEVVVDIIPSVEPLYVHADFKKYSPNLQNYAEFYTFIKKSGYLNSEKVQEWIESVLKKALSNFKRGGKYFINNHRISVRRTGPAHTLLIQSGRKKIDVDLVPCFSFDGEHWPRGNFRPNPVQDGSFYIVPKNPKGTEHDDFFVLNFQKQERLLMKNRGFLKPVIKILKKMVTSSENSPMVSYYLKNAVLWIIDEHKTYPDFWGQSFSAIFIEVITRYKYFLGKEIIPYFWNSECNLIEHIPQDKIKREHDVVANILQELQKKEEPWSFLKYILPENEYRQLEISTTPPSG